MHVSNATYVITFEVPRCITESTYNISQKTPSTHLASSSSAPPDKTPVNSRDNYPLQDPNLPTAFNTGDIADYSHHNIKEWLKLKLNMKKNLSLHCS